MSSEKGLRAGSDSRGLEALSGAALFVASAAWVLWQNRRVAVLWDLSYLLDSAWRFSLGQVPYKDLPFAHAPLTFLIHMWIIRVFGRVYWPHAAWAVLAGGCGTVIAWRLLAWALEPVGKDKQRLAFVLALPLVPLGIYSIYPHPIYDSDCTLAVLAGLLLVTHSLEERTSGGTTWLARLGCVGAGAICALPVFFKQNIGLPFLGCVLGAMALLGIKQLRLGRRGWREAWVFAGGVLGLALGVVILAATSGVGNYLHWTMKFAAQRRLPRLPVLASVYQQPFLSWALPCAAVGFGLLSSPRIRARLMGRITGSALLLAPFGWTAVMFFINTDPDPRTDQLLALWPYVLLLTLAGAVFGLVRELSFRSLLPWIVLATIHATFLSQQLWGSTYAIWPLLMLLIASLLALACRLAPVFAMAVSTVLVVYGGIYSGSLERLGYIHLEGARQTSSLPALRGMVTPGPWLPGLDEVVRFADAEIPPGDGVVMIPGEDPFYFATGRTPRFPILLFDPATDPYSPEETVSAARAVNIRWLLVKREMQLSDPPHPQLAEITAALEKDFKPYRRLTLYDVYRR